MFYVINFDFSCTYTYCGFHNVCFSIIRKIYLVVLNKIRSDNRGSTIISRSMNYLWWKFISKFIRRFEVYTYYLYSAEIIQNAITSLIIRLHYYINVNAWYFRASTLVKEIRLFLLLNIVKCCCIIEIFVNITRLILYEENFR